jgi:translation initiation factor 4B
LGNLSYDATNETVTEFFEGCEVASVRIIEDREMMRPKGFGYVEFATADGIRKALDLDGQSFQSRMIKIKIADPRMLPPLAFLFSIAYIYRSSWR